MKAFDAKPSFAHALASERFGAKVTAGRASERFGAAGRAEAYLRCVLCPRISGGED